MQDPETGNIETEPTKQAQIEENHYTEVVKAVYIKHGKYLLREAPRKYPSEQAGRFEPVPNPFILHQKCKRRT
eukprot:scaffold72079_cov16-Tisochrysis_lutea.AAC.1